MKQIIQFIVLMSISMGSYAACSNIACDATIKEFYLRNSENIYIAVNDDLTPLNCTAIGNKYLTLEGTHKNAKTIYSALLAAKTTESIVKLRIVQGSTNCAIDYVRVF